MGRKCHIASLYDVRPYFYREIMKKVISNEYLIERLLSRETEPKWKW